MSPTLARGPALTLVAMVTACAVALASVPARAQGAGGLPVIRDAEIEQLLRDYSSPILKAAGLGQRNIRVVIINDRSFNAFVIDAKRIFVNAGALMDSETPNQIIGVMAHETGHITGGHLSKLRSELANAQTAAILTMLLGVGAMAAAATSRSGAVGGNPAIGMIGAQGVIERSLLAYARQQEEQADRAGVGFLKATGQSPKGMYETFKRFADQMLFSAGRADPYLQSHPMPTERLAALSEIAKNDPNWNKKDPPELQARHDLMRAKLFGFMERPDTLLRRYPPSDTSLPARYARAVSTYRHADLRLALGQMDALIAAQPNNPYFYELKGQALVEAGRTQEAIPLLRHAISLAPDPTLMRVLLGQALVATSTARAAGRGGGDAAPCARDRSRPSRRLRSARHGLWAQERPRRRRPRLGRGGAGARAAAGGAPTCESRQGALSDRITGLGESRRHRVRQAATEAQIVLKTSFENHNKDPRQ